MDIQNEIWRDVVGYEGWYQGSTWGRVKRLAGKGCQQERILKPIKGGKSYLQVSLCKDGKVQNLYIHRLVGMTFPDLVGWADNAKGKPFEELEINHKNEKEKTNNRVENLEWCDCKYNNNYGTHNERSAKARSKTVAQKTLDGKLVKIWPSAMEIHRQTGWCQSCISKCCRGEQKSAYGYVWSYTKKAETV